MFHRQIYDTVPMLDNEAALAVLRRSPDDPRVAELAAADTADDGY